MYTNTSNTSKGGVVIESGSGATLCYLLMIVIKLEIVPSEISGCSDFWRLLREGCAVKIMEQKHEKLGWLLSYLQLSFITKFQLIEVETVG